MNNLFKMIGTENILRLNSGLNLKTFPIEVINPNELRIFLKGKSFIYAWFNDKNNKIYIGSAIDGLRRMQNYCLNFFGKLSKRRVNKKFLNSFRKYGAESFKLYILEIVIPNKDLLIEREQFYLDLVQPYVDSIGFNIAKFAKFHQVVNFDEKAREKISLRHTGENSEMSKLKDEDIVNIKKSLILGLKLKELSNKYNVSTTVISNIKRGLTWSHIKLSEEEEKTLEEMSNKSKHKLNESIIKDIKMDFKNGMKSFEIAKKYNLIYSTVHSIKNGHIYSYITAE